MIKINPLSTLYVGIDVSSKSNYVCALDFYKNKYINSSFANSIALIYEIFALRKHIIKPKLSFDFDFYKVRIDLRFGRNASAKTKADYKNQNKNLFHKNHFFTSGSHKSYNLRF